MSIEERLQKLERQVRFYRGVGLILVFSVFGGLLVGFQSQQQSSEHLTATTLMVDRVWANQITFLDGDKPRVFLNNQGLFIVGETQSTSLLMLDDPKSICLTIQTAGQDSPRISLCDDVILGPSLELRDKRGFRSKLGVSHTVNPATGEETSTSAASLTFFDKEGKVIRQLP